MCGLLGLYAGTAFCQSILWGGLKPGPYAVGFRSSWSQDPSRTYGYKFGDGTSYGANRPPRPILVNVWYPAVSPDTAPMREGDYLEFVSKDDSLLSRFARELVTKNQTVIASDVFGSKPAPSPGTVQDFLQTSTFAHRNAAAAAGQFPLLIYIQGYGSSLQDNSALCEYMASNGYVVIGSAYQDDNGKMIADKITAVDDVRYLVSLAREMPQVDIQRVGLIGHSGGAQTSMVYASQPGSIVDAVVSLDTTQDYYFADKHSFKSYVDLVNPDNLKAPLLVAASRSGIFQFVDTCSKSDRLYLIVDELGHDEFTSEGLAAAMFQKKTSIGAVRERYTSLCEFVLRFLDAKLKASTPSSAALANAPSHFALVGVSTGENGPPPYIAGSEPPSPRQFRDIIEADLDQAIRILNRFAKSHPKAPIYEGQLAFTVVDHLLENKNIRGAKRYSEAYKKIAGSGIGPEIYLAWGDIYAANHANAEAILAYEKALMLDPSSAAAKARIAKLRGKPN